ncbi:MAG: hypothetical protein EOP47_17210 [Sphingobacteriaceae bacterium]|nr:MAG: hypothetical protein EOP47_17210 [Sphingobacteriaceae bacterium]
MKNFYLLLVTTLLFAAVAISNTGCKPETVIKIDTLKGASGTDEMSFKLDGGSKIASSVIGQQTTVGETATTQITGNIGALGTSTEGLTIIIKGDLAIKTYPIDDRTTMGVIYHAPDATESHFSQSGSITVTSISGNRVIGTFNCTVKTLDLSSTKEITDGKFSAEL